MAHGGGGRRDVVRGEWLGLQGPNRRVFFDVDFSFHRVYQGRLTLVFGGGGVAAGAGAAATAVGVGVYIGGCVGWWE